VQIAPDLDSADGTVAKVCQAIAEAAAQGAQLVVFPETFVPYYPYFSFVRPPLRRAEHLLLYERAVEVPGPVTQAVSAAARRMARWWCWASTNATTARSTTRSWSSTPMASWC
jgi:aliphatic nitrilase